jgi:hypothetical protein
MLRLIFLVVKLAAFAAFVLVLGNLVHWKGRTISDQVRTGMASATWVAPKAADLGTRLASGIRGLADDAAQDIDRGRGRAPAKPPVVRRPAAVAGAPAQEGLRSSERQKLRALIRELNTARETTD